MQCTGSPYEGQSGTMYFVNAEAETVSRAKNSATSCIIFPKQSGRSCLKNDGKLLCSVCDGCKKSEKNVQPEKINTRELELSFTRLHF